MSNDEKAISYAIITKWVDRGNGQEMITEKLYTESYFDSLKQDAMKLREALQHPDINGMTCECGYCFEDTEETGMSICFMCNATMALADFDKKWGK